MKLYVVICLVISVYSYRQPTEKERIYLLGEIITNKLLDPEEYNGTDCLVFVTDLYKYHNYLQEALKDMKDGFPKGIKVYQDIIKKYYGPPYLEINIDYDYIYKVFDFDNERKVEIKEILNITKRTWKEMEERPKPDDFDIWYS